MYYYVPTLLAIGLTLPHKPGPRFPTSYVVVLFVLNSLRSEVTVLFVDIGRIVCHHCLSFIQFSLNFTH